MSEKKHTPLPWRLKTYHQLRSLQPPEIHGPPHPVDGGDYSPLCSFSKLADAELALESVNSAPTQAARIAELEGKLEKAHQANGVYLTGFEIRTAQVKRLREEIQDIVDNGGSGINVATLRSALGETGKEGE